MNISLLIGLGNPGTEYRKTRHNIGFVILDALASRSGFDINKKKFGSEFVISDIFDNKICLIKPQTFMNVSGEAVGSFWNYYKVDGQNVFVIHDDLDLPLGKLRISFGSGAGGHNGISSIIEHAGTKDFYRLRFGIGRPIEHMEPADFVLSAFDKEEKEVVSEGIEQALKAIEVFYKQGPKVAMQLFNK